MEITFHNPLKGICVFFFFFFYFEKIKIENMKNSLENSYNNNYEPFIGYKTITIVYIFTNELIFSFLFTRNEYGVRL